MASLKALLRKDENFQRYLSILETSQSGLSLERIQKESASLHAARTSRGLWELRVSPIKLQNAILVDCSTRSRLTELKATLLNREELLTTTLQKIRKYIRVEFAESLREHSSTQAGQVAILDRILSDGTAVKAQIESTLSILDVYIKDIDQSGYALTGVRDTLRMVLDRKESSL